MSQQTTLPVTLPLALSQQPLKPASPPADTQQEQARQPTPLPGGCQKAPSELPGEVPLVHGEKHATPVKGLPEQDTEPQRQEQRLEQPQQQQESREQEVHLEQHLEQHLERQQQQQEQHEDHLEAESVDQQLEEEKVWGEQQLEGELGENKQLLDQQLDRELAKGGEQLEEKGWQLLEPREQREGRLEPPAFLLAPGQVQETRPVPLPQGAVVPAAEQQQKQEVQWPPRHK